MASKGIEPIFCGWMSYTLPVEPRLHTAGDAISVLIPSKQQKIVVGATAEPSMLKPENRWNETKIGELILDVPFFQENAGLSYSNSSKFDSWAPSHVIWN